MMMQAESFFKQAQTTNKSYRNVGIALQTFKKVGLVDSGW
jgi:hypothetical protein